METDPLVLYYNLDPNLFSSSNNQSLPPSQKIFLSFYKTCRPRSDVPPRTLLVSPFQTRSTQTFCVVLGRRNRSSTPDPVSVDVFISGRRRLVSRKRFQRMSFATFSLGGLPPNSLYPCHFKAYTVPVRTHSNMIF